MPKRKCVCTLIECCLYNIAKNIDNYWCFRYLRDTEKYLYVIGPFEELAEHLIEGLIKIFHKNKLLRHHHLKILLNSSIRKLNISGWNGDLGEIIPTVAVKCQKLTHLNISGCSNIPLKAFLQLPESLPLVVSLNFGCTKCFDQVLGKIGKFCKHLRELDVSLTPVTDFGISSLCINMDELEDGKSSASKLIKLVISETKVTNKGARCALINLPNLVNLEYHNSLDVVTELYDCEYDRQYKLLQLSGENIKGERIHERYFEIAHTLCPNVTYLKLVDVALSDDDLLLCAGFENLTQFQLLCGQTSSVTFYNGITALLQMRGTQITALELGDIDVINIPVIGQLCPNLELLSLYMIASYDYMFQHKLCDIADPFSRLKELDLIFLHEVDIPEVFLKLLLTQAKHLRLFHLHNSESLSDQLFLDVLTVNPLSEIKDVAFEHCPHITGNMLKALLMMENELETFNCLWCSNFTLREFQECEKYVREQNLDVNMQWL
ncbi:uncharacterized protein LOC111623608 [Centruroides sculpturatus]|uniref:uncharacterized protein LOC111623608 n=1 Tax=Centruroides sculpturatus TaxID=218467 RepID=UPI000C6D7BB3|nr:uncharacterized protein LOC111623608 [Centruroides sculpturatus]XP_023222011.1 uncharacterized protein LOC111623608 [Centruroides sculpturatus]